MQEFGDGVRVTISQSFTTTNIINEDGWTVTGGQPLATTCNGINLFGGYNVFGANTSVSKIFSLPPHYYIYLKIQFWKIDTWLYKNVFLFGDGQIAWNKLFYTQDGTDLCGQNGLDSHDYYTNFSWRLTHSSPTAGYWGMRDFSIDVEKCPDGCLLCKLGDTINDCSNWKFVAKSWDQLDIITADGWNVVNGLLEMTKCGPVALFRGFGKFGAGSIISTTFDIQYPHFKIKIFILWAKIDAWDNEAAQILVDGTLVWEKKFIATNGYYGKVCGNSQFASKTLFSRTELEVNHQANSVKIQVTTNLNEAFDEESFGVRDFYLYYQECPSFCNQCTGPNGSDCLICKNGYYRTGVDELMCQECYISCETCQGPTNQDCTDCGNYELNKKEFINGQCLCPKYMAEQIKNDGSTWSCHPMCEKCEFPQDNTNNQYCTMCLPGQHRIVSDDLKCIWSLRHMYKMPLYMRKLFRTIINKLYNLFIIFSSSSNCRLLMLM
ncbi:unnamed protein product [Paramecium octaurelia]|uniref:TNFR-Cys domain-containing protein n=1 Tax=Paramecium octaurelia TaxID=43137 RepID=A0A8S1UH81_PAROT|nr:unnamed protein product [Paramecium octaurelia]